MVAGKNFNSVCNTYTLDFEVGVTALYAKCFGFIGNRDCTTVIITENDNRLVAYGGVENPFTRDEEVVAVYEAYHNKGIRSTYFFTRAAIMLDGVSDHTPYLESLVGGDKYGVECFVRWNQPYSVSLKLNALECEISVDTAY